MDIFDTHVHLLEEHFDEDRDQLIATLTEAGVKLSLMTQVVAVVMEGHSVKQLICHAKSGFFAIEAKMVIDGTGDGDICAWAGAPFEKEETMPGTLCSLWGYIDYEPDYIYVGGARVYSDGTVVYDGYEPDYIIVDGVRIYSDGSIGF